MSGHSPARIGESATVLMTALRTLDCLKATGQPLIAHLVGGGWSLFLDVNWYENASGGHPCCGNSNWSGTGGSDCRSVAARLYSQTHSSDQETYVSIWVDALTIAA